MIKRIFLTPGEPAGIGPDIALTIAKESWPGEIIVVADPQLLEERRKQLKLSVQFNHADISQAPTIHTPHTLKVLPVNLATPSFPGKLDKKNASYVVTCLEKATAHCLEEKGAGLVTGPVQKSILNTAGIQFSGHTEFLAALTKSKKTVMLFVVDKLKVAIATTHLPLADVPKAITKEMLAETIQILSSGLKHHFGVANPRILVCGLNPHAGENGYLGKEEITTITPTIDALYKQGMEIIGPLPADSVFTPHYLEQADVILAMYHDQALPVVKYAGFNHAVNVTLGLPFIRTSVDHGTALTLAGSGKADAGSLAAAICLAFEMV